MAEIDEFKDEESVSSAINFIIDGVDTQPEVRVSSEVLAALANCREALEALPERDRAAVLRIVACECGFNLTDEPPSELSYLGGTFPQLGREWAEEYVVQVLLSDALLGAAVGLDEAKREIDGVMERLAETVESQPQQRDWKQPYFSQYPSWIRNGAFSCDKSGRLLHVNSAGVELLGYDSKQQLIDERTFGSLFSSAASWEGLREFLFKNQYVQNVERELVTRDGSRVRVLTTARLIIRQDGELAGFEGIWFDVTERRRLQQLLVRAMRLETARQLARTCCQQITQPLAALCCCAHLLLEHCQCRAGDVELPKEIYSQVGKIAQVIGKMRWIRRVVTKECLDGGKMLDLDASSSPEEPVS
jgi:PAS domain S-box-containing protein